MRVESRDSTLIDEFYNCPLKARGKIPHRIAKLNICVNGVTIMSLYDFKTLALIFSHLIALLFNDKIDLNFGFACRQEYR